MTHEEETMERTPENSKMQRIVQGFSEVMSGWKFPSFAIFTLIFFEILMIGLLAIPTSEAGVGAFARDFRTWCFNYDPATGQMDWFYVTVMLSQPLALAGLIGFVWRQPLADAWKGEGASLALVAGVALLGVGLVGITFVFVGEPDQSIDGQYPFPAERIRTAITPPSVELLDQNEEEFSLEAMRGKVVVVTAIYARCGESCPIILTQLRRITDAMEVEADELVVVGITLDPERDGAKELTQLADRHRVGAPLYRLLHGDSDRINDILDGFSFARIPDEERGEIDHANLFIVIDRDGKIAYRISLGERTESWLTRAVEVLLEEGSKQGRAVADRRGVGE